MNLRLMPVIARVTTVDRDRGFPTAVELAAGEVEGLPEDAFALAHDLFLAGPAAPAVAPAGQLGALKLVELRHALAWTFSLAD
ncbi:MAG: hypothetical protein ACRDPC_16110 [Solirubrobacteraceae bacterium]